jgi:hypothetical protein
MRNFGNDYGSYDREFGTRPDRANTNFQGGMGMAGWHGTGTDMTHGTGRGMRYDSGMQNAGMHNTGMNYDREYGVRNDRNFRYDQTFRGYDRGFRGYDNTFGMPRYDREWRDASTSRGHDPFPTRPSVSSNPMAAQRPGYDRGFFGMRYDSEMQRYDRNFGDFRNSYFSSWF